MPKQLRAIVPNAIMLIDTSVPSTSDGFRVLAEVGTYVVRRGENSLEGGVGNFIFFKDKVGMSETALVNRHKVVLKDVDVEVKQGIPAPEERSGPAGTIETA